MTIDDLKHIFRFQTTATADYTPSGELEYTIINDRNRVTVNYPVDKLADIIPSLDGLVFEGYNNRTPIFIKPEV
jgi:hypothetical protein